jgi:predicted amino acid-binding ACT domain protein
MTRGSTAITFAFGCFLKLYPVAVLPVSQYAVAETFTVFVLVLASATELDIPDMIKIATASVISIFFIFEYISLSEYPYFTN